MATTRASGFEFLNVQGGADFKITRALTLGPFMDASLAEYSHDSYASRHDVIQEKALHTWLTLGVKSTFGPQSPRSPLLPQWLARGAG